MLLSNTILETLNIQDSEWTAVINERCNHLEIKHSDYPEYFSTHPSEAYEVFHLVKVFREEKTQNLSKSGSYPIGFVIDQSMQLVKIDRSFSTLTHWEMKDVAHKNIATLFDGPESERYFRLIVDGKEEMQSSAQLQLSVNIENSLPLLVSVNFLFSVGTQFVFSGVIENRAVSNLEKAVSESKSISFLNNVPVFLWAANNQGQITFLNEYAQRLFEIERGSDGFFDTYALLHPEDVDNIYKARDAALENQTHYIYAQRMWIHSEKKYKKFQVVAAPTEDPITQKVKWYGAAYDIDNLENTKNQLEESKNRISILMDNLPGVVYQCLNAPGWPMVFMSEGIERLTGISAEDFVQNKVSINDFIHKDYQSKIWKTVQENIDKGDEFEITYPLFIKNEKIWIWEQGRAYYNQNGEHIIEGLMLDITAKIETENKLKRTNSYVESITTAMPNMVIVTDLRNSKVEYANAELFSATGYTIEEINRFENGPYSLIHPDDLPKILESTNQILHSKEPIIIENECRALTKNNEYRFFRIRSRAFQISSSGYVEKTVTIIEDITERKNTKIELEQSKINNEALLNGTLHAFYLLDADFKLINFNKVAAQESKQHFSIDLYEGMSFLEHLPETLAVRFKKSGEIALSGKIHDTINKYSIGSITGWYRVIFNPVRNKQGRINGFVYSSLNLTELVEVQLKLKDQESLLQSINQNIQEGIYRRAVDGEIIYVNEAFAHLFGFESREDFLTNGKSFNLYKNPTDREELSALVREKSVINNVEVEFVNRQGESFWGLLSSRFINDAQNSYYDGSIRDIGELKRIQEELIEAKQNAEEMNKLKSSFLANMSHEIRTPINGIIGLAQVMEFEDDINEIKNYIDLLKTSGNRLLNTITSILDLSRLESNKPDISLKTIEINELVQDTYNIFKILTEEKTIQLTYQLADERFYVLAEENILHQVLNNLIGNAIKFTLKGEVSVKTRLETRNKIDFVAIDVSDTGIGISEDFTTKIFEPFQQASQGQGRAFQGSGLGLSIAKKYAELLGGKLNVESQLGKGSTFTLLLPLKEN